MCEFTIDFKKDRDTVTGHPDYPWQAMVTFGCAKCTIYAKTLGEAHEKALAWMEEKVKERNPAWTPEKRKQYMDEAIVAMQDNESIPRTPRA